MKKNKTYQIVMIAMFIALEVVLEIINSQLPSFEVITIFFRTSLFPEN